MIEHAQGKLSKVLTFGTDKPKLFSNLKKFAMNATTEAICLTIDPELLLPNTAPSQPIRLKGSYVAFPERGSNPRAYKLHKADADWKADGPAIANVFVVVDEHGQAQIS